MTTHASTPPTNAHAAKWAEGGQAHRPDCGVPSGRTWACSCPLAEPQAMTLSHDRFILRRAEEQGGRVVVVRCPHAVGLAFELEEPEGFLGLLPCPCNDPSEVVARVVPVETATPPGAAS